MPKELGKCKPQVKCTPKGTQNSKHSDKTQKNAPKTSAQPITHQARQNLTLHDWMTVFKHIDNQPKPINQGEIIEYFQSRPAGVLIFTQSTLSRKLKDREKLENRVSSNPNALSSKRPCIVTRPDVDEALSLWVRHMEEKQLVVNSAMLTAKRVKFEDRFNVPEEERLRGRGWIRSFCHAYVNSTNRKEYGIDSLLSTGIGSGSLSSMEKLAL